MKYKRLVDLTDDELREIVTELFSPKEIKMLSRNAKSDKISCQIITEWGDDGTVLEDILTLYNPFETFEAINIDFINPKINYLIFAKFCFAKGVVSRAWLEENKWLEVRE